MTGVQKLIVAAAAVALFAVLVARPWEAVPPVDEAAQGEGADVAQAGREEVEDAPPAAADPGAPAQIPTETEPQFDPAQARADLGERLDSRAAPDAGDRTSTAGGYAAVDLVVEDAAALAGALLDMHPQSGAVAVVADIAMDGAERSAVPLLLAARDQSPHFAADGRATRWVALSDLGTASLRIDVAWLDALLEPLADGAAPAFSAHDQTAAQDFAKALQRASVDRLDGIATLAIDQAAPGYKLVLGGATDSATDGATPDTGAVIAGLRRQPPQLAALAAAGPSPDYRAVAGQTLSDGDTVAQILAGLGPAAGDFWNSEGAAFAEACATVRDGLLAAGLAPEDAAVVLVAMMGRHGWFADDADYAACLDGPVGQAVADLGLEIDDGATARTAGDVIKSLGAVGAALRSYAPEQSRSTLQAMVADTVTIRDPHGLLAVLSDDPVAVHQGGMVIHPAADGDLAVEYLLSLPVSHFACYSGGSALRGIRRVALVELENDPFLWQLDVVFGAEGRIAALRLAETSQARLCRSIAGRPPESRCYFGRADKRFRNVDPAQC